MVPSLNTIFWILLASTSGLVVGIADGYVMDSRGGGVLRALPFYILSITMYIIGFSRAYDYLIWITVLYEILALVSAYTTFAIMVGGFPALSDTKIITGLIIVTIGSICLLLGVDLIYKGLGL